MSESDGKGEMRLEDSIGSSTHSDEWYDGASLEMTYDVSSVNFEMEAPSRFH